MENRIHRQGVDKPVKAYADVVSETETDILLELHRKDKFLARLFPPPSVHKDRVTGLRGVLVNIALRILWKYSDDSTMSFTTIGEKYPGDPPQDVASASLQVYTFDFCTKSDRKSVTEWLNTD